MLILGHAQAADAPRQGAGIQSGIGRRAVRQGIGDAEMIDIAVAMGADIDGPVGSDRDIVGSNQSIGLFLHLEVIDKIREAEALGQYSRHALDPQTHQGQDQEDFGGPI